MSSIFRQVMATLFGSEPQAWLFDSTAYCRIDGLDPEKIKKHNFAGMLIQTGRGNDIADTLQDQIDVAEECDIPWAGWHIFDPRDGSVASQSKKIIAQPRVKGHLLINDIEPREAGNMDSIPSPSGCHDALKALADVSGRASWGYGNPNILLNYLKMPDWVYDFDWWIAQYPSSSWKTFEEFLKYYAWKYPSYFAKNAEFCKRIKMWQWTQWGDAQYYYAADTIPSTGGPGIQSGDLDIAMMTFAETQRVLAATGEQPLTLDERVEILWNGHEELWP